MRETNAAFTRILVEAGLGPDTIEYIEHGLRDEDLVVVPVRQAFLVIGWRVPRWLKRRANRKVAGKIEEVDSP